MNETFELGDRVEVTMPTGRKNVGRVIGITVDLLTRYTVRYNASGRAYSVTVPTSQGLVNRLVKVQS